LLAAVGSTVVMLALVSNSGCVIGICTQFVFVNKEMFP